MPGFSELGKKLRESGFQGRGDLEILLLSREGGPGREGSLQKAKQPGCNNNTEPKVSNVV
jgi:hypothetical protein